VAVGGQFDGEAPGHIEGDLHAEECDGAVSEKPPMSVFIVNQLTVAS
jgi:hypothetical protein